MTQLSPQTTTENFADLLEKSLKNTKSFEGQIVKGTIMRLDKDAVVIDVGLKSEGRVALREFGALMGAELKAGDLVDVYVERMENRDGEIVLSREKARREAAWEELEESFIKKERVMGVITSRVKGGFTVDLAGASAFLPGSQIDVRPIKDMSPLMHVEQPFIILKMDRLRGNIVVSRRAILEESRAEARSEIMSTIQIGNVLEGTVKNVTDYGAFVDLGGVDGLLHVTDISWSRVNHPSQALSVGQTINVKVIKITDGTRISLGMKQLTDDPWKDANETFSVGSIIEGLVTNVMEYGVFVELAPGIEGLIHASELSWTKKSSTPSKVVAVGDRVKVKILDVDLTKYRISLSLKQCTPNPWDHFADTHPIGTVMEGEVRNSTEFGLFIGLVDGIDGMAHISDLSWDRSGEEALAEYKKGQKIQVKILDISVEKERISLGIKQLVNDPFADLAHVKEGDVVTCSVQKVSDKGLDVVTDKGLVGFIRKSGLAKDRNEQRPERFAIGERVDAQVMAIDPKTRTLTLSIKAREAAEEKEAMAEFGSSDSGASLGDILGAAIDLSKVTAAKAKGTTKAKVAKETDDEEATEPKAKTTKAKKEPKA